ncbi:alpha/beta family hydrolase [Cognatiluteimonas weifangensis]|uniref:Phosphoribosyltransferase n=1 Tax=Cognatiluteimonas weifangensis TaxID=2303539 RepID=A0A372DNQ6_9GAMM|nr:alpha/beta family hydrolase [Luteimonas weifangensis]RFP61210.1 phosphoribosyltransferase [Luteimonas weifangensis]
MSQLPFRDRSDAARQLAAALAPYRKSRPVVLAIPRGAVPMGRIVADELDGELDVVLVRKLGAPGNPEYAIGAVDEQGRVMLNPYPAWIGADDAYVDQEAQRQLALIRERRQRYRGHAGIALGGRTVIVLDDGIATGATMLAALKAVRAQDPARLVCAVPVAARDSLAQVERLADHVVCLATPSPFIAVGQHYLDFPGVSDEDVARILARDEDAFRPTAAWPARIRSHGVVLEGELVTPIPPHGLVIFAHGSGSSRRSPRNRQVAAALQRRGLATLLFDLLTPQEDQDTTLRFDIPLLTQRLEAALDWVRTQATHRDLAIGLFGASTGAAAALALAAARPAEVVAVVSRGGRPDLAGEAALTKLRAHVLLIVGGADTEVLALNRAAQLAMRPWANLAVVPGATHLFEEPGALERAAELAGDWFGQWLDDRDEADPARGTAPGHRRSAPGRAADRMLRH